MILEETEKSKFVQINNKRYYFSNGILSLPFSYPFLKEIVNFKREKNPKKSRRFYNRKRTILFKQKNLQAQKNKRISIYRSILQEKPAFYHLDLLKRSNENN